MSGPASGAPLLEPEFGHGSACGNAQDLVCFYPMTTIDRSVGAEQMTWTTERVLELRKLWATGASTAEIGRRLGVSKNAVVGKAHRSGLAPRPSPIRRPPPARPKEGCGWQGAPSGAAAAPPADPPPAGLAAAAPSGAPRPARQGGLQLALRRPAG